MAHRFAMPALNTSVQHKHCTDCGAANFVATSSIPAAPNTAQPYWLNFKVQRKQLQHVHVALVDDHMQRPPQRGALPTWAFQLMQATRGSAVLASARLTLPALP